MPMRDALAFISMATSSYALNILQARSNSRPSDDQASGLVGKTFANPWRTRCGRPPENADFDAGLSAIEVSRIQLFVVEVLSPAWRFERCCPTARQT